MDTRFNKLERVFTFFSHDHVANLLTFYYLCNIFNYLVCDMIKKSLLSIVLMLVACTAQHNNNVTAHAATMPQMRFHCQDDTLRINQLLQDGINSGITHPNALVEYYGRQLLGTPYVGHTLEGEQELLTINIHELDCTTFIETLYALARTTLNGRYSWRDYAANLENIRYRGGVMGDYASRLHYISDWLVDNQARGNVQEITDDLPHATSMVKTIDFMSTHRSAYPRLAANDSLYNAIRNVEIGYRNHRMPYLKKSWLSSKDVKAALQAGDFVALVTTKPGLDASHVGIVVFNEQGEPCLLHASSTGGKVMISQPLVKYLGKIKSNIGVRVFRMKP